jgi:NAD(P) transhydrogenase subunit alpha
VALDPSCVERLIQAGIQIRIEAECGHSAGFHDDDYPNVTVMDGFADVVSEADVVVKVVCPTLDEIQLLSPGTVLICIMSAFQHTDEVAALSDRRITLLAMDHMPRTTRAQPLDALSSQATVAGYKAALLAAELSPRLFPMLTTAAGTIRPSRVLVIGAGVAGLQAIATSRRLGAQVEAYDIRRAAKEQIESLGARMVDTGVEVEGAGGLARALRKDEKQKQHDVLAKHLAKAHVVICAASIPGRRAPKIISEDMVDGMLPESVIVDLAASTGGNCELTRIGEHCHHNDTLIVGPLNLPSHGAVHASEMYARNVFNMLMLIIKDNEVVLNAEDEIIARCVVCHDGQVNHGPTAALLDRDHVVFGGAVHHAAELPDQTAGWLHDAEVALEEPDGEIDNASGSDPSIDRESAHLSEPLPASSLRQESPEKSQTEVETIDRESRSAQTQGPHEPDDSGFGPEFDERLDEDAVEDLMVLDGVDMSSVSAGEEPLSADDLTRIDGVGPALQERLFAFGYRHYWQLAELDAESIKKLSVQLELGDEIEEQDWAGQARRLLGLVK